MKNLRYILIGIVVYLIFFREKIEAANDPQTETKPPVNPEIWPGYDKLIYPPKPPMDEPAIKDNNDPWNDYRPFLPPPGLPLPPEFREEPQVKNDPVFIEPAKPIEDKSDPWNDYRPFLPPPVEPIIWPGFDNPTIVKPTEPAQDETDPWNDYRPFLPPNISPGVPVSPQEDRPIIKNEKEDDNSSLILIKPKVSLPEVQLATVESLPGIVELPVYFKGFGQQRINSITLHWIVPRELAIFQNIIKWQGSRPDLIETYHNEHSNKLTFVWYDTNGFTIGNENTPLFSLVLKLIEPATIEMPFYTPPYSENEVTTGINPITVNFIGGGIKQPKI